MPDFPTQFDDSLLSAYVDGELTVDERAEVEAYLDEHAEARQLVEELRATAEAVHGLPKESLPIDLSAAVIERLRQTASDQESREPAVLPQRGGSSPGAGGLTRWQWSLAALAAVLMIALFIPRPDRNVADGDPLPGEAPVPPTLDEPVDDRDSGLGGRGITAVEDLADSVRPGGVVDAPPAPEAPADEAVLGGITEPMESASGPSESGPRPAAMPAFGGGGFAGLTEEDGEAIPVVVGLELSHAVLAEQRFDRLLVGNGVIFDDATAINDENANSTDGFASEAEGSLMRRGSNGVENGPEGEAVAAEGNGADDPTGGVAEDSPTEEAYAAGGEADDEELGEVHEAILVEVTPEQFLKCLDDLSDNMSVYNTVEIDISNASEPLQRQVRRQQNKFDGGEQLKGWVRDNREVLEQEAYNQVLSRQQKAGYARSKSTGVEEPEDAQAGKLTEQPKQNDVDQRGRGQVLYSNNVGRAGGGGYFQYDARNRNFAPNDSYGANTRGAQANTDIKPNVEQTQQPLIQQQFAQQRSPSKQELSRLAERAMSASRAATIAADNAAASVPKMKVLFLLRANDLPDAVSGTEEAAELEPSASEEPRSEQ